MMILEDQIKILKDLIQLDTLKYSVSNEALKKYLDEFITSASKTFSTIDEKKEKKPLNS